MRSKEIIYRVATDKLDRFLCFVLPEDVDERISHHPPPAKPDQAWENLNPQALPRKRCQNKFRPLSSCLYCEGRREERASEVYDDAAGTMLSSEECFENPRIFSYPELYIGSNGFGEEEVIGVGGFGKVYKTVLPSDGTVVAVKCCWRKFEKTFAAELAAVANLRHRNLVRLRGWSVHDDRLLLVYDYMPNRSLDRVLFHKPRKTPQNPLVWERRKMIISGLACALNYLHNQLDTQIIHRDVKTSNVMLDSNYTAKLGDFGLARWLEHDTTNRVSSSSSSSIQSQQFRLADSSKIGGTIGYLPPESFQKRNSVTTKSDVFSFGIVVLEVVSGRRALDLSCSDERVILLDYARKLADENKTLQLKDDRLEEGTYGFDEMRRMIHIGLLCTLHSPRSRPDMKWVVDALSYESNSTGIKLKLPSLPSFKTLPLYITLSSDTNQATTTSSSGTASDTQTFAFSNYVTAPGETVYISAEISHERSSRSIDSIPMVETPRDISYNEILSATNNFSESQRVAEFDFGPAYRGLIGTKDRVLIKRLGMKTCPALRARFSAELRNLGRLRHRNLVQLRGWCTEQGEMLVVYNHYQSQLLSNELRSKDRILQWNERYNILKSIASAVLYLHEEWEEQVIHRNITSSAIILDHDLNPKLGSFALAEFLTRNENGDEINSVRGIFGYMSPEYIESGKASPQADVYSFGVLILEMITGQPAVDFRTPQVLLVGDILRAGLPRSPHLLIDKKLNGSYVPREFNRLLKLGMACSSSCAERRPTMRQIMTILDGNDDKFMKQEFVGEGIDQWKQRNAASLSLIRRIHALGIH